MLNQKQLFVASRLFVAAGKVGERFDLSKFSNDREYALATVAALASRLTDPEAHGVIAEMMVMLNDPSGSATAATGVASASVPTVTTEESAPVNKYVGRLR